MQDSTLPRHPAVLLFSSWGFTNNKVREVGGLAQIRKGCAILGRNIVVIISPCPFTNQVFKKLHLQGWFAASW